jgi:hypothetical protein
MQDFRLGKSPPVLALVIRLLPALLFFLAAGSSRATSFSGILGQDDQVALFNLTANTAESIASETSSYATGGFAPAGFLFDGPGDVLTLTNGTGGQVGQDPATLNCADLYFQDAIGAGSYCDLTTLFGTTRTGNYAAGFEARD